MKKLTILIFAIACIAATVAAQDALNFDPNAPFLDPKIFEDPNEVTSQPVEQNSNDSLIYPTQNETGTATAPPVPPVSGRKPCKNGGRHHNSAEEPQQEEGRSPFRKHHNRENKHGERNPDETFGPQSENEENQALTQEYQQNYESSVQPHKNRKRACLPRWARITISIAIVSLGLVFLVRLVRCCKKRRQMRKERREQFRNLANQYLTQPNGSATQNQQLQQLIQIQSQQIQQLQQQNQLLIQQQQGQISSTQALNVTEPSVQVGESISLEIPQHFQLPNATNQQQQQIELVQAHPVAPQNNRMRYPVLIGGLQQQAPMLYAYAPQNYQNHHNHHQ